MKSQTTTLPRLLGVVNVTPDSFSDGGRFLAPEAAVAHALELEAAGADELDLGAESTRPGAKAVSPKEQLRRLLPVVKTLRRRCGLPLSVDTRSAFVARACLDEGAEIINDVSALRHDPRLAELAAERGCRVILMHMRGEPRTMQKNPRYRDVVRAVVKFFEARLRFCRRAGIAEERIILDPGIGFGKTVEHNLELLRRLPELTALGRPVMIGVSRKSFLGKITGEEQPARRVSASVAAGLFAAERGAAVLRVHDVAAHRAAVLTWAALRI